ncbi:MAG: hypothetical protein HOI21_02810, partial [Bacteroidetes Order II. Incertae sedis bacterium]|nr:hypothetical protein [Bacteroidetes Order II. bacterium]
MDKENPMVTISLTHFYYNAVASRLLELQSKRVIYHVDEEERKIGFDIIDDDHDHSYSVFAKTGGTGFGSASSDIVRRFDWIKAVASLKGAEKQKFRLR